MKLFELLVLSQALAELTWPVILEKRDALRFAETLKVLTSIAFIMRRYHVNDFHNIAGGCLTALIHYM